MEEKLANRSAVVMLSIGDWAKIVAALMVASAISADGSAAMDCDILAIEIRKQIL